MSKAILLILALLSSACAATPVASTRSPASDLLPPGGYIGSRGNSDQSSRPFLSAFGRDDSPWPPVNCVDKRQTRVVLYVETPSGEIRTFLGKSPEASLNSALLDAQIKCRNAGIAKENCESAQPEEKTDLYEGPLPENCDWTDYYKRRPNRAVK